MIKNISLILVIVISTIYISSCSDEPSSFGGILNPNQIGLVNIDSFNDSLSQSSSSFKTVFPLGASQRLLVGKRDNIEASFLLKFLFPLSDSLKNELNSGAITISDAKIILTRTYQFGDSLNTLSVSAHKVTSDWSSIGFTSDSLPSLLINGASSSIAFDQTDSINTLSIDVNLVRDWMQSEIDISHNSNKGIYIQTLSATKVVGFQAFNPGVAAIPKLQVVFNRSGIVTDTITYLPGGDVSIVKGNLPSISPQNIVIQSGLVVSSKLRFDLSSIPSNSIVNSANLTLTLDTLESFHTDFPTAMLVNNIIDSTSKIIDSTLSQFALLPFGDSYNGNITSFVQKWVSSGNNQGMIISPELGIQNVDKYVFKGSNSDSLSQRPRLEIIYTKRK